MNQLSERVRLGDPDRFMSVMAAPDFARDGLFTLYAFNLEIARAPWASSEELICEMRLQWWVDAIDDLYRGTVRAHEVLEPLARLVETYDLPQELLAGMVEARRFDVFRNGHADRAAFDRYINATSGSLMLLAAKTLGSTDTATISNFAYGAGVANLFKALPALYAQGRDLIPVDGPLDINAVIEGRVPDNLETALVDIAKTARTRIRQARQQRGGVPVSAMLTGWQATVPLDMVLRDPRGALKTPLETSEFRKKLSLIWRSSTGRW